MLMSYLLSIGLLTPPVGTVLLITFPMPILWLAYASGFAIK
jgi:TRAP-type C4-dicarboxylate transport system permease large subunit